MDGMKESVGGGWVSSGKVKETAEVSEYNVGSLIMEEELKLDRKHDGE